MSPVAFVRLLTSLVLAAASPAAATTIQTQLEGMNASSTFGFPIASGIDTAVGMTFTLQPGQDTVLDSITFHLDDRAEDFASNSVIDFKLYVYEWNGALVAGSERFQSAVLTTGAVDGFESFSVPTGGVALTTGVEYIWLISAAGLGTGQFGTAFYGVDFGGENTAFDPYPHGRLVSAAVGDSFANLFVGPWSFNTSRDLAFTMELSVPEPGALIPWGLMLAALAWRARARGK